MEIITKTIDNVQVINSTMHPINFLMESGEVAVVPPSGVVLNAKVLETPVGTKAGATLVKSEFVADPASEELLSQIEKHYPDAVVIGSIIAAQAFPGRVLGMTPAPGFERVPPAEKRMSLKKFTTF